jgi:hypothetical protein
MRAFSLCLTSILASVLAFAAAAESVPAQPTSGTAKPKINQCFYSNQFQGFRAIDDRAFYMRVNVSDIYRIDLASSCPELRYPDARLITVVRGSSLICGPLDWDLRVGDSGPGAISEPCIVSAQTRLTKDEVAAIPRKLQP